MHRNKFEWVNPRSRDERKNQLCVSSKNVYIKDNDKPVHWVGNSKSVFLDIDSFFKRKKLMKTILV